MLIELKDVFDKMNKDRYVIGYDLNNQYAQISFCRIDSDQPETFSLKEGQECYNIPLAICHKQSTGQWLIGSEAYSCAEEGDGEVVTDFYEIARRGGTVEIDREEYHAKDLLSLFIKRSLSLLPVMETPEKIANITFAIRSADGKTVKMLQSALEILKIEKERISLISYEEAVFFYVLYQNEELQNHQILIFDAGETNLWSYRLERNRFISPAIATVEAKEYKDFKVNDARYLSKTEKDTKLLQIATQICENKVFSGVYLIGEGFYEDWCNQSLRFLCRNRRVFKGNNLFSKGACLAAKEKITPSGYEKTIRYFGADCVKCNLGISVNKGSKEATLLLAEAGNHWYETDAKTEIILRETDTIPVVVEYINSRQKAVAEFVLNGLPMGPGRMTRVEMDVKMQGENHVILHAVDLGFGEIYPSTQKEWTEEIELQM